jgi:hypothetical protein
MEKEVVVTPQQKFAQNLLNLATWYASHPDAPCQDHGVSFTIGQFSASPEQMKAIGAGEKKYDDQFFRYIVKGDGFCLEFIEYRANVCKKVVVGTKVVPAMTLPAQPARFVPEHEEEITEWECPGSMLSPSMEPLPAPQLEAFDDISF